MTAVMAYRVRARVSTTIGLVDCTTRLDVLANGLALSPYEVTQMIKKCPSLLETDASEYMRNMVWLKQCFPSADISKLLQNEPSLIILSDSQRERVMGSLALLHEHLAGAPIDLMVEEDPLILFEDLKDGLVQLRELWPDDVLHPKALSQSEPTHLVLAIRALSPQGGPRRKGHLEPPGSKLWWMQSRTLVRTGNGGGYIVLQRELDESNNLNTLTTRNSQH
eukprot:1260513-Pyramimonas_sp.AAC.1